MNVLRCALPLALLLCAVPVFAQNTPMPAGPTLTKVKAAKSLACGVDFEEVEYSTKDAHGNHSGLDLDLCKALAVSVLGPNAKFSIVPYRAEDDALKGLKSGEVDVIATATPNFFNTTGNVGFSRPVFYDFQGLMVNKLSNIKSAKDLAGKKVCFIDGNELSLQIQAYMKREGIKWMPFPFQEEGEMEAAFVTGNCAAVSADISQLAFERIAFKGFTKNCEILSDIIAKDPLAMAYRTDDPQWAQVVNWTVNALIQAEESGVTSANVTAMKSSDDMIIQRLLGVQRGYGQYLGLDDAWAARTIEAVGNYGEMFDRDLGPSSIMHLQRGANNLWTHGGLMIADPIR